eukprot:2261885-Prymnesium_polylepis.1
MDRPRAGARAAASGARKHTRGGAALSLSLARARGVAGAGLLTSKRVDERSRCGARHVAGAEEGERERAAERVADQHELAAGAKRGREGEVGVGGERVGAENASREGSGATRSAVTNVECECACAHVVMCACALARACSSSASLSFCARAHLRLASRRRRAWSGSQRRTIPRKPRWKPSAGSVCRSWSRSLSVVVPRNTTYSAPPSSSECATNHWASASSASQSESASTSCWWKATSVRLASDRSPRSSSASDS